MTFWQIHFSTMRQMRFWGGGLEMIRFSRTILNVRSKCIKGKGARQLTLKTLNKMIIERYPQLTIS